MTEICPECGDEFQRIGQHWSMGGCSHLSLSSHQKEVITGLVMGDGWIQKNDKNPRLSCEMISPNYLSYVDNLFGILGLGVSKCMTSQESAAKARSSGFGLNAKEENYSDLYRWRTRRHPELDCFADWYSSGEKVWPSDIELTPTVLRHYYCGDGCWNRSTKSNNIDIGMSNEIENTEKVSKMFENVGLPAPSNFSISERKDGSKCCKAQFTKSQSKELFEYMEHSLPDFDYKFPDEYC